MAQSDLDFARQQQNATQLRNAQLSAKQKALQDLAERSQMQNPAPNSADSSALAAIQNNPDWTDEEKQEHLRNALKMLYGE